MLHETQSKVQQFYRGATVLIAGGTGFLGKVLLEKSLRTLPVKKIYLLIRSKRDTRVEDRFVQLLEDRLFDQVRELVGCVEPIEVDYDQSGFGLQNGMAEQLQQEVDVVFYCLADVNFNLPLKKAFGTNVRIARDVFNWCRSFSKLKAIVHTSTFYSECNKFFIGEKVYDELPFGNYELCMKLAEDLTSDDCEKIKANVLGDYPNTYVFTKKLAEIMINREFARDLPIGIYRPPVVSPTYCEPVAGWMNNFFGLGSIIRANIDGVNQVILGDTKQASNYAPVDCCVNAMLVCAYDISQRLSGCDRDHPDVTVYNHVSKNSKYTYDDIFRCIANCRPRFWERWMWKNMPMITTNEWLYYCLLQLSFWYAGFKDLVTKWINRDNKWMDDCYYRKSLTRYASYSQAVAFALKRSWSAYNTNLIGLKEHLNPNEEQLFYFDLDDIEWPRYVKDCVDGVFHLLEIRQRSSRMKM